MIKFHTLLGCAAVRCKNHHAAHA